MRPLLTAFASATVIAASATSAWAGGESESAFQIHGLFFADALTVDDGAAIGVDDSEADLRLAELSAGFTWQDFTFTAGYDFARDGEWRDVGVRYSGDGMSISFGQFKSPISMDKYGPQGGTVFLEPARFTSAFGIKRRLGIVANFTGERGALNFGAFRGSLDGSDVGGNGQGQTALTARASFAPVLEDDSTVHFGAYARHLDYDDEKLKIGAGPHTVLLPKTQSVTIYSSYGFGPAETSFLTGVEAAYSGNSWFVSSEYASMNLDARDADGDVNGGYVQASYALTGESRRYSTSKGTFYPVSPANPLGEGGYGAFEVMARIDHLNLEDFGGFSSTTYSVGGIWTPNSHFRVLLNYVSEQSDAGGPDNDVVMARLQTSF